MADEADLNVSDELLQSFADRYIRLEEEKKDIGEQQKELMAEAKSANIDTKILKKVIAMKSRNPDDLDYEEVVTDRYKKALNVG